MTGIAAALLAGCSNSERLRDPFGSPFQTSAMSPDLAPTSSIAPSSAAGEVVDAAPVSPVQSRPLSPPAVSAAAPSPQEPRIAVTPTRPAQHLAGWSAEGGTPISVAQGENAAILATRYGIPEEALVRANGYSSAAQIKPGAQIVIPVYNAALAASSGASPAAATKSAAAPAAKPAAPPTHSAAVRPEQVEAPKGEMQQAKAKSASKVAVNSLPPARPEPKPAKVEAEPKVASKNTTAPKPVKEAAKAPPESAKQEVAAAPPKSKPEPAKIAKTEAPPPEASAPAEAKTAAASEGVNPEFRWPARGRIIQAFKPGGNDGINIAVPEGTSVKAAESGVVAYAGSELKGYGNLILIRHPNGFVTAYANNSDIEVKRGETVKRGQTIAKSGQSGNVASPQLHFELRKGSTPVDPTQYLAGL